MVVFVRYCSKCRSKVSPQEIERNQAYEYKDNCVCRKCFAKLSEKMQNKIKKYTDKKLAKQKREEEELAQASTNIGIEESSTVKALQNRAKKNGPRITEKSDRIMAARSKMYGSSYMGETTPPPSKSPVAFILIGVVVLLVGVGLLLSSKSVPVSKNQLKKDHKSNGADKGPKKWEAFEEVLDYERDNPLELAQIRDRFKSLLGKAPSPRWRERVQDRVKMVESAIVQAKKNGTYREPSTRKVPPRPPKYNNPRDGKKANPDNSFSRFMASRRSSKFHKRSCEWGQKISKRNLIQFKSREEAVKTGRRPCGACRP